MSFDPNEFPSESATAEQVLAEVERGGKPEVTSTLSEAVKRIEEANLLKTLVNADIFAPNSAAPEVLESVKQRLQAWALNELEILLGMKQPAPKAVAAAKSQFDDEETLSLKKLAAKMLGRDSATISMPVREPAIMQIGAQTQQILKNPQTVSAVKLAAPKAPAVKQPETPKAQVKQKDGTYRDVNHGKKTLRANGATPLPMPNPAQATAIASTQAISGATAMGHVLANPNPNPQVNGSVSNLISAAIQAATGGNQVAVLPDNAGEAGDVNDRF